MGWLFTPKSRDELIRDLIKPQDTPHAVGDTIAHALCGKELWSVRRITAKQAGVIGLAAGQSHCYIHCDLLEPSSDGWGYKSLEESMSPYYYNCPLQFLDMAPVQCPEWRERVRAYHDQQGSKPRPTTSSLAAVCAG
jgi:hypothetical protein